MKLVTYAHQGSEKVGIYLRGPLNEPAKDRIIDVGAAGEFLKTPLSPPGTDLEMLTIIRKPNDHARALRNLEEAVSRLPANAVVPAAGIKLLSPIPRPVSMRDGYAFRQHVESARKGRGLPMIPEFDNFPVFYFTNHLAVTGPGEVGVQKLAQERLDFELEIAIVIGKKGRNIKASEADDHIFGYTIMNDWSARALQTEEMKLNLGPAKGKDFATSLGPWLVTRDELAEYSIPGPNGERHNLTMKCRVNGVQVSLGNSKDMNWTFGQILERASYGVTLYPGEVIGSGTVGTGCFMELNGSKITDNQWLKPGDEVVLEVDGLGKLENVIRAAGD